MKTPALALKVKRRPGKAPRRRRDFAAQIAAKRQHDTVLVVGQFEFLRIILRSRGGTGIPNRRQIARAISDATPSHRIRRPTVSASVAVSAPKARISGGKTRWLTNGSNQSPGSQTTRQHPTKMKVINTSVSHVFNCLDLPILNNLHDITNLPETAIDACGLGWRHTVRAADLHEIMVHGVKGEGVNVVFDLL